MKKFIIPLLDLFFNLMIVFCFLFVVVLANIQERTDFKPQVRYVITLEWEEKSPNDIDLWLKLPNAKLVGFPQKQQDFATLERDDQGIFSDTFIDPSGNIINFIGNQEILFIREAMEGPYVIGVHYYSQKISGSPKEDLIVKMTQVTPFKEIFNKKITLDYRKEETAAEFFVARKNKVPQITEVKEVNHPFILDELVRRGIR